MHREQIIGLMLRGKGCEPFEIIGGNHLLLIGDAFIDGGRTGTARFAKQIAIMVSFEAYGVALTKIIDAFVDERVVAADVA